MLPTDVAGIEGRTDVVTGKRKKELIGRNSLWLANGRCGGQKDGHCDQEAEKGPSSPAASSSMQERVALAAGTMEKNIHYNSETTIRAKVVVLEVFRDQVLKPAEVFL